MRKINEIFYSLQGEGHHTGYPSVFIRFSGCNLNCPFCDTNHDDGIPMTDDAIVHAVNLYKADWIVLTGGEPSLFIDREFIHLLKRATGKKIAIETNGTHPLPEDIDWITVSPKEGMVINGNAEIVVDRADELKVVDIGQDLSQYFTLSCVAPSTEMVLQPCWDSDEEKTASNIKATISRVLADPRWRLSLQTHKFVGIR